ncbi:Armadillo repeat-containing kinesin-like protein 2 [Capsicum baccatum]|uniref:Armadillo repeat-containing kinesin-like protein 2 n=1 Tax=Capsicum baccatum TaxID=33114 RepID=A0A2G2XKI0_CAPBA|nr:Armadillo repeat-containing kinesin-like protein 2 [Capsicum baccatum]
MVYEYEHYLSSRGVLPTASLPAPPTKLQNRFHCAVSNIVIRSKTGKSLLIEDGILPWIVRNANNEASPIRRRHIELALCHLAQHEINAKDMIKGGALWELVRISRDCSRDDIRTLAYPPAQAPETVKHCLIECHFAKQCWIQSNFGWHGLTRDFVEWFEEQRKRNLKMKVEEAVMILWSLWEARNNLCCCHFISCEESVGGMEGWRNANLGDEMCVAAVHNMNTK